MMSDEELVLAAIEAADRGARVGEMPVGAAVFVGDVLIADAHTQERTQRRRIVHADLMAMEQADRLLGFTRPAEPITLAVNLEPCLMCLGAAITLGVSDVVYALESPDDGGVEALNHWSPRKELPYFRAPARIVGGILRERAISQFGRYARSQAGSTSTRGWAASLAAL